MSSLLGPKTVVFSKAFGRYTRQTATIPRVRRHACWFKKVPVGKAIFVPEGFLLPDPQASFVANSDLLRDCSAAQPNPTQPKPNPTQPNPNPTQPNPKLEFSKKKCLIFDLFVHFARLNSGWGVRISVSFFGNYMSNLLGLNYTLSLHDALPSKYNGFQTQQTLHVVAEE